MLSPEGVASAERCATGDVVVVGCGNLLRGDDAAGPLVVRRIEELGVPRGVRLADAGTSGIDVALAIDGAREAIVVDACASGAEPGTTVELKAGDLAPPVDAVPGLHSVRWDRALAFARRALGERYPRRVSVVLIEIESTGIGAAPTARVARSIDAAARALIARLARR